MSRQSFRPNESAPALERIDNAVNYIFGGGSGLAVARIALQSGAAEVIMGGYTFDKPGPAANVIALARHQDGQVIYENHVKHWRDTDSLTSIHELTNTALVVPRRKHVGDCILNLSRHDCVRFDVWPWADSVSIPRYAFGKEEPTSRLELPESGRLGVARMVEGFATGKYADMLIASELQEALIVMGGAATVFRDPAMRVVAGLIGEPG